MNPAIAEIRIQTKIDEAKRRTAIQREVYRYEQTKADLAKKLRGCMMTGNDLGAVRIEDEIAWCETNIASLMRKLGDL